MAGSYQGRSLFTRVTGAIFFVAELTSLKSGLVFGFLVRLQRASKSRRFRSRPSWAISYVFLFESTWNAANLCFECVPLFALRWPRSESVWSEGESFQRTRNDLAGDAESLLSTKNLERHQAILLPFRKDIYGAFLAIFRRPNLEKFKAQVIRCAIIGCPLFAKPDFVRAVAVLEWEQSGLKRKELKNLPRRLVIGNTNRDIFIERGLFHFGFQWHRDTAKTIAEHWRVRCRHFNDSLVWSKSLRYSLDFKIAGFALLQNKRVIFVNKIKLLWRQIIAFLQAKLEDFSLRRVPLMLWRQAQLS